MSVFTPSRLVLAALVAALAAAPAPAQTPTGTILGSVKDAQGGVVPGATVTATNLGTQFSRGMVTDAAGEERLWAAFGGTRSDEVAGGWEDRWRAFHRPVRIGPLWVGPPWEEPDAGAIAVVIDPGRAFGTCSHATTRLCLELMLDLPRQSLLDVGSGRGAQNGAAIKDLAILVITALAEKAAQSDSVPAQVRPFLRLNASQIAEWTLAINDQKSDEPQVPWQLDDRIRLTLRWAKDGPYRPASNNQPKGATVDKNDAISFEWAGRWALIRFLRNRDELG